MRRILVSVLTVALFVALAAPAHADTKIDGDGYSIKIPTGFKEALSMESSGGMKIRSQFGTLPIDGMPEIKAYIYGDEVSPRGVVMLARVNLSRTIDTAEELGLDEIEKMRSRLPEGFSVSTRKIGEYHAVEMAVVADMMDEEHTARILTVACGDYVVVVMMDTVEGAFPSPDSMWSHMVSSLKIEPGINKVLLFGAVGVVALALLIFLGKIGSRDVHQQPNYTGRFTRFQDQPVAAPGIGAPNAARPQTLPSRSPGAFDQGGGAAPVRTPTSPAVTRPARAAPPSRPGLRSTLPESGQWGE